MKLLNFSPPGRSGPARDSGAGDRSVAGASSDAAPLAPELSAGLSAGLSVGLSVEEARALRDIDLIAEPGMVDGAWTAALDDGARSDLLRLGPAPSVPMDPHEQNAAMGRLLESFRSRRSLPASTSADAAVQEAKMLAVLTHIHRLRLEISSRGKRLA